MEQMALLNLFNAELIPLSPDLAGAICEVMTRAGLVNAPQINQTAALSLNALTTRLSSV